jgi:DNA polymerase-3 subunit gamma/tau
MNYIEIDGASNNSVDDVRELIENVQYLPTRGEKKIYVIDEVHMLSVPAFNALLKTLEEPPAHALFILATTDPQKILGTVISRTQRYDFKNVSIDALMDHVLKIAEAEGLKFENKTIPRTLAQLGQGSVRDMLSIFDQVVGLSENNFISESLLSQSLGMAQSGALRDIVLSLINEDAKSCKDIYEKLIEENVDIKKLCDQILNLIFNVINSLSDHHSSPEEEIISRGEISNLGLSELFWIYETLVKDLIWAQTSINPEKVILIILQKICYRKKMLGAEGLTVGQINKGEVKKKVNKSWGEFLTWVRQISPATEANLAHGNLLQEVNLNSLPLIIEIAFPHEASVFKEYLDEKETCARLKNQIAEFYEVGVDKLVFRTSLLTSEQKNESNFKTLIEIEVEKKTQTENDKRNKILNDPFIKEAEKLFHAKIDRIVLKNEENNK